MTMIHFTGAGAPAANIAEQRAAFQALPPDQQAAQIARFEALRAAAAAVKVLRAQAIAARAIQSAQLSSAP